ncbi:NAD(P)-dependent oxidoreductase [Congregibacter sp.]|jgi:nucleoside-diphosphate-sugar epimerase|uniref:NAD(P)-dependent oxidoreductase n=1 Tax=Congregibacter sp. TaxID=2744308 RepID=UPI0039E490BE
MTTLVVGASGATGRLLVEQLLERGKHVKVIVRSKESLLGALTNHDHLSIIQASVLDLSNDEMIRCVSRCDAIASCLGHNLSFKGMFWPPRRLVTDATRRLCNAVKMNEPVAPVKFLLMNTTGNRNRDLDEEVSTGEKFVTGLLRLLLPAHADNEDAAEYLRTEIGQTDGSIEWTVVRPDSLIDEAETTDFSVHSSPIRSAIFDAGKTSRINVGCFMADLIGDETVWKQWIGKMPVIYNR